MAKLSNTVKEIIQIVIFLVVVGVLLTAFVIYPLSSTKAMMGRVDIDDYSEDSVLVNDPSLFIEAGLSVDTFKVDPDGLTTVAGLIVNNQELADSIVHSGTVFLLHDDMENRDNLLGLTQQLNVENFKVIVYDQRATGR
jgi:hypothetical protein